ncbi:MAG TPA: serine/threonine-protein kinase [Gaiellaceae bacterium]|nr:serine/threonine-protein kinase [Gaiellaceae bacterium]
MPETLIAGRYRLDELIGRGGMSEVWVATDLELGRRVAVKLLAPNEDIARFEREARAVAALADPNVTQLYDYGESDGRPFMVLEYLSGGSLEDLLRANGALPDGDTHRIAAEIAAGLAHAHARGVIHRDLKPSNVLFDEEGRAKLSDFGIARMAAGDGTLTEAGTVLGTAAYISPEQAAGLPATAASDVYSFGVLLFRMLTARLPFESDDPLTLVVQHRDEAPPLVTDIRPDAPLELAATATAALTKDPAARPPNGAALVDALAGVGAALGADTEVTRVMAGFAPPPRRPRRGRVLAVAVLLILALAGGVLAYAVTRPADGPRVPAGTLPSPRSHSMTTRPGTATTASTTTTAPATTTAAPTTTHHIATTRPATTTRPAPTTTFAATTTSAFTTTTVPTTTVPTTTVPTTTETTTTPATTG